MPKTFGTKEPGSLEPETLMVEETSAESSVLRAAFFVMAGIAVMLFAYNMFFAKPQTAVAATDSMDAPISAPMLRTENKAPAVRFPELDAYLDAKHVDPTRSRINKYVRTASLLDQCGAKYAAVLRDYNRKNHSRYAALTPPKMPSAKSTELNAENMKLGLSISQDNSAIASVSNAQAFSSVKADRAFSRHLSSRECSYVSQRIRAGELNI